MIKSYFKQAFRLLKENKLLSSISIIDTTLATTTIMATAVTLRATVAPFVPGSYRDRMLIFRYAGFQYKTNENWQSNGPVSYKTAKACFKEMAAPEAVTITSSFSETTLVARPTGERVSCSVLQADDDFWKVFKSDLLLGYPFDKAIFDAGTTKVVISGDIAWQLFGTSDVVGKALLLSHSAYMICGVVRPVSKLARYTYAQIWIPLSSTDAFIANWGEYGIMGTVSVYILAKSQDDFPATRMEVEHLRDRYTEGYPDYELLYCDQPDTYFAAVQRYSVNNPPAVKQAVRQYIIALIILLVAPAVNLSGLTLSRVRKRPSEIGIRKAFGAPRREPMIQVLFENMLYSLLGGVFRLILSHGVTSFLGSMLFSINFMGNGVMDLRTMCMDLLLNPVVFLFAFFAYFTFNLLSAAIPVWRVIRTDIVDAINEK